MDVITIVSLISSLITIEEAGRNWGSFILDYFKINREKKKLKFAEWDTEDEVAQMIIDAFKGNVAAAYKEHIFQKEEIEQIADAFLKEKSDWYLDYFQRKAVRDFISRTLEKYNEYNRSQMSLGERIIEDSIECVGNKLESQVEQLSEKVDGIEQLTVARKENTEALCPAAN